LICHRKRGVYSLVKVSAKSYVPRRIETIRNEVEDELKGSGKGR
jgi:hypothetical protein